MRNLIKIYSLKMGLIHDQCTNRQTINLAQLIRVFKFVVECDLQRGVIYQHFETSIRHRRGINQCLHIHSEKSCGVKGTNLERGAVKNI